MRISYLGVDVAFAPLIDESRQKACSNMSFPRAARRSQKEELQCWRLL
jgi:hypothetical protein